MRKLGAHSRVELIRFAQTLEESAADGSEAPPAANQNTG